MGKRAVYKFADSPSMLSSSAETHITDTIRHLESVEIPWIRFGHHDLHPDRHSTLLLTPPGIQSARCGGTT
jgi:hypothetical protein